MMLCGIDEAGRGCIAGSLFVSCVVLPKTCIKDFELLGVKDSKKLSYKNRNILADKILNFLDYNNGLKLILSYSADDIDNFGISFCMRDSLKKIYDFALKNGCKEILFDGNTSYGIKNITTIIKGDSLNSLISAASILSKTNKDKEMIMLDSQFPMYNFKGNKGYLTKQHIENIKKYGYSNVHRKSFHVKSLESYLF